MSATLLEQLQAELPIHPAPYALAGGEPGLLIANAAGSPRAAAGGRFPATARTDDALAHTARLARRCIERRFPVLAFVDAPDRSGSALAPALAWLADDPDVTVLAKDCANGFVAAIEPVHHGTHGAWRNRVVDWVNAHRLHTVLMAGLGTDVCVLELALALLSARDHGMMPTLRELVVVEPATASHDLPPHHLGLHLMAARGAVLASEVTGL